MLFDDAVVEMFGAATPGWLAAVLLLFGFMGSVYVVWPAVLIGVLSGGEGRMTWPAIVCAAYGTFVFSKPIVGLNRPAVTPPISQGELPSLLAPAYDLGLSFTSGSFPSGHALVATVFFGLLVVDLDIASVRVRAFMAATVISVVGLSRVVFGVHYPGDILGGVVLGLVVLTTALSIRKQFSEPVRPLLVLALFPSVGAIITGRPVDGFLLTMTILTIAVIHGLLTTSTSSPTKILKKTTG